MVKRIVIAAACLCVAGCAFTPHEVRLQPMPSVAGSTIGRGTLVYYRFSDERDDTTVGHRSVATVGAKISAPDLASTIDRELRRGIQAKGYEISPDQSAASSAVTFRLRSFKFEIETGFFSGAQNASAVLAVDALRGGRAYTNVYRSGSEQRIMVVPGGDAIDAQMNTALTSVLQQALSDGNLDLFLTARAP